MCRAPCGVACCNTRRCVCKHDDLEFVPKKSQSVNSERSGGAFLIFTYNFLELHTLHVLFQGQHVPLAPNHRNPL